MSMTTLMVPVALRTSILPFVIPTSTRLATTSCASGLRFEVPDAGAPSGKTSRNVAFEGATAVTLTTTAVTPLAGTPPNPPMVTARVSPDPIGPLPAPVSHWLAVIPPTAGRVSQTRNGVTGVNGFDGATLVAPYGCGV